MAVVALTTQPQTATIAGTAVTANGSLSISDTYTFQNDGSTYLKFIKTGAGACTVTIAPAGTGPGGNTYASKTVTVPATTGNVLVGPFPPSVFNDANGNVSFTCNNITGLSVEAYQLPRAS